MTQTTDAIVATNAVVSLDNAAGVLTDISGNSNKVELGPKNGVAETRVFGNQWMLRGIVGKDVDISLDVLYTSNAAEGGQLLDDWFYAGNDSARTLQIDVPDSDPGSFRYSGEVILSDFTMTLDATADEWVMCSAKLLPSGAFTKATIGT
ncbi:MAG: hypothetical protein WC455_18270 [Dehalococcoidia bacterium]|jgi:hypothetical protein